MKAWNVGVLAVCLMGLPSTSVGQGVARSFDELRLLVKAGDTVYVTEGAAERAARIIDISSSSMTVSTDGAPRELTQERVTRIRQRRPDSLWNGAAIGAGVLLGAGLIGASSAGATDDCDAQCWTVNGLLYGGLGALAGMGVDALIKGKKTIYAPAGPGPSAQVVVSPLVYREKKGVRVQVRF
jgi:hypothetical protein